jgi:hypothetical protein
MNIKVKNELIKIFKDNQKVILSGEDISTLNEEELQMFKKFIYEYHFKIVPIIVVRSPYSRFCSSIQQNIKGGHYIPEKKKYQSQIQKIKKIQKVFKDEKPIFLSYKKASSLHKLGTAGTIMELMGIDINKLDINSKVCNESKGNKITRIANELNKRNPIFYLDELGNKKLNEKYIDSRNLKSIPNDTEKYLLTEEELSSIKKDLNEDNDFYLKEFGPEYCDTEYPTSTPINPSLLDSFVKKILDEQNEN